MPSTQQPQSPSLRSVFLSAVGHGTIELCSSTLPVIYPLFMTSLDLSFGQIGTLALVSTVCTTLAQPLFGYLSDLWGPQRLSALSVAWIGVWMGLVGLMNNYALLAVMIGLAALGSAAFHPPGATIASSYAGKRRGVAVSIFSIGGHVGSTLSPLLITAGLSTMGTRSTLMLTPIALISSVVLFVFLGKQTPRRQTQTVESSGQATNRQRIGLGLIVLSVMCLAWFQVSFRTYLPLWIKQQSASLTIGARVMSLYMVASGVGSFLGGALSDRFGRWQMLLVCLIALSPMMWFFVQASGPVQWILVAMLGILTGAMFPVSIVLAHETWPHGMGIASGLVMGLGWVPGGIGASVTGRLADSLSLADGLRSLTLVPVVGVVCMGIFALMHKQSREPVLTQINAD